MCCRRGHACGRTLWLQHMWNGVEALPPARHPPCPLPTASAAPRSLLPPHVSPLARSLLPPPVLNTPLNPSPLPQALLHAPLLRNHYLLNRHARAACPIAADGGFCINCELVGRFRVERLPFVCLLWGVCFARAGMRVRVGRPLGCSSRPCLQRGCRPTPACGPCNPTVVPHLPPLLSGRRVQCRLQRAPRRLLARAVPALLVDAGG